MLRLHDRYIFTEWLKSFGMALALTLMVLLIEDLNDDLPDFLNWEASLAQIFGYYARLIPTFLPTILPLALLLSLLFTLSNLHRNYEIIALRAAGMNVFTISRSLWLAGLALSGLVLYLNATLVPAFVEETRQIRRDLQYAKEVRDRPVEEVGLIGQLTFDNRSQNRRWFMEDFSDFRQRGRGVNVYFYNSEGYEVRRLVAREAYYDAYAGHWFFQEGRDITFDPRLGEAILAPWFGRFPATAVPELTERPETMLLLSRPPRDLSLVEIRRLLERIPLETSEKMRPYAVRYHTVLAGSLTCLAAVGIAVPFAVAGVRTNPLVGVSKCIGWFFGFFIVSNVATMLGEQNHLDPILAAWLPIGLVTLLALYFMRRAL
ncbi:MAG: LptF/LptG family permease [Opitutales bacterium]